MQRIPGPYRVFVGLVQTGYLNDQAINRVVRDGMLFCGLTKQIDGLRPSSKVVLKADLVLADDKLARHTYTHPEVTRAVVHEILRLAPGAKPVITAETARGLPGYRAFHKAHGSAEPYRLRGYYELEHQFPGRVSVIPDDETAKARYRLAKGGVLSSTSVGLPVESTFRLRASNEVVASRHYSEAGFTVYLPKIKGNVLAQGFSGAIMLGSPQDNYGMANDHHVCDMLEVCNPQLVVSDGLIAAVGGNSLTQRGHELGVILVSNNALAHDWIAAQILNLDPMKIGHLHMAQERGWGPASAAQIELGGAGLQAVQQLSQKTKFWDMGSAAVQEFAHRFERDNPGLKFPLEIISGPPYEAAGSHGLLLEWLYQNYDFPQRRPLMARWPKLSVCVGGLTTFPLHYVVAVIGAKARQAMNKLTSSSTTLLSLKGLSIQLAQLKNGKRHLIVSAGANSRDIGRAMTLASFGRIRTQLFRVPLVLDKTFFIWRTRWRMSRQNQNPSGKLPLVMTSRLAPNAWWSLRVKHPEASAP